MMKITGLRAGKRREKRVNVFLDGKPALGLLAEVALKDTIEEGSEEGEFDETYRWQMGVRKVDVLYLEEKTDYKPHAELYQIQVSVIWKSGLKERSTRIETYKTVQLKDEEKKT